MNFDWSRPSVRWRPRARFKGPAELDGENLQRPSPSQSVSQCSSPSLFPLLLSLSSLIPMKISMKRAYKTLHAAAPPPPVRRDMRRRRKQRRRRRRGRRRRNLRSEGGPAAAGRQAGGVSTIVLKTPGWNSKDAVESLSPSRGRGGRERGSFRLRARTSEPSRPPSKSSDVAGRAHDVIVVAETKLCLRARSPLPPSFPPSFPPSASDTVPKGS